MDSTTVKTKIEALGHEKAATFMGCIYVNYLVWMNGGLHGYSHKALQRCEENAKKNALESSFESLINAIVAGLERVPQTVTEEYFQRAYQTWFIESK